MEYNDFLMSAAKSVETSDKMFLSAFGVRKEKICENVIISPGWNPERIFNMDKEEEVVKSSPLFGFKVWNIPFGDLEITYVKTGYGAPMVLDAVLLLGTTKCKNILFLSSVGALSEKFKIGDIVIPKYCICGDGASRYIGSEKFLPDVFGEKVYPDNRALNLLTNVTEKCCCEVNTKWHSGETFCADTIVAQYRYIEDIIKSGCNSIDMESAVFFKSAKLSGMSAAALMQVSDNAVLNKSLFTDNISKEEKAYRRYVRDKIISEIIKNYFNELVF